MSNSSFRLSKGFFELESRYVYAVDRRQGSDAPLVFLPDGGAPFLREACHARHLWCPFPGCNTPFHTTRGGDKRHCFVHEPSGGARIEHSGETYYHQLGKRLVAEWARRSCPGARVEVEKALENGQRPDVLVHSAEGHRFAFEVQYAHLTPAAWTERHEGYRALGVTDVWLFGHLPPHLQRARPGAEDLQASSVPLHPTFTAVLRAGVPLLWLVPEMHVSGMVGTPWVSHRRQVSVDTGPRDFPHQCEAFGAVPDAWTWLGAPPVDRAEVRVALDALEACSLEGARFCTPAQRVLEQEAARILELTEGRLAELAVLREQEEARRRAAHERSEAERSRVEAVAEADRARREQAWREEQERFRQEARERDEAQQRAAEAWSRQAADEHARTRPLDEAPDDLDDAPPGDPDEQLRLWQRFYEPDAPATQGDLFGGPAPRAHASYAARSSPQRDGTNPFPAQAVWYFGVALPGGARAAVHVVLARDGNRELLYSVVASAVGTAMLEPLNGHCISALPRPAAAFDQDLVHQRAEAIVRREFLPHLREVLPGGTIHRWGPELPPGRGAWTSRDWRRAARDWRPGLLG